MLDVIVDRTHKVVVKLMAMWIITSINLHHSSYVGQEIVEC
jgi:hypothetical protein